MAASRSFLPIDSSFGVHDTVWFGQILRRELALVARLLEIPKANVRRLLADGDPHVYARMVTLLLVSRVAGKGTFVDVRAGDDEDDSDLRARCPACGCRSFVSFCGPWIEVGKHNSFCDMDEDKSECALCTATFTRRELCGEESYQEQKKRIAEARRELRADRSLKRRYISRPPRQRKVRG